MTREIDSKLFILLIRLKSLETVTDQYKYYCNQIKRLLVENPDLEEEIIFVENDHGIAKDAYKQIIKESFHHFSFHLLRYH